MSMKQKPDPEDTVFDQNINSQIPPSSWTTAPPYLPAGLFQKLEESQPKGSENLKKKKKKRNSEVNIFQTSPEP